MPTPTTSPDEGEFPNKIVYAGWTEDDSTAIAVAILGTRAAAYLCDGDSVEAWLRGTVDGNEITLTGKKVTGPAYALHSDENLFLDGTSDATTGATPLSGALTGKVLLRVAADDTVSLDPASTIGVALKGGRPDLSVPSRYGFSDVTAQGSTAYDVSTRPPRPGPRSSASSPGARPGWPAPCSTARLSSAGSRAARGCAAGPATRARSSRTAAPCACCSATCLVIRGEPACSTSSTRGVAPSTASPSGTEISSSVAALTAVATSAPAIRGT